MNELLTRYGNQDVCVTASAGAGKTRLLIEAYFRALDQANASAPNGHERVVAITFTNEAASEIRRRVLGRLLEDGAGEDAQLALSERIGTIHGFCHGLLRELGHLVGQNPAFELPEDGELLALQHLVADRVAMELLTGPGAAAAEKLIGAHPFFGGAWQTGLAEFVHACMTRARWLELDAVGAGAAVRESWARLTAVLRGNTPAERMASIEAPPWSVPKEYSDQVARALIEQTSAVDALARFVERYTSELDREKGARGWLSQDDALYHAARLVRLDDVREFLRERYEYLLVDEYQDTDPLQHAIVERLGNSGKVFRVGDLKQSIYRFRSARPTIFRDLVNQSAASGSLVRLERNNRAVPDLRDAWNAIFERVFASGEVDYAPLEGNQAVYDKPRTNEPAVEVFRDEERLPGEQAEVEARWIAGRIGKLVGVAEVWDRHTDKWRTGQYRDVAILLRVTTRVDTYVEALRAAGIPYVFLGGEGFWKSREVRTLVTAIEWLADPTSRFHTASVLRSTLFGVRDEALARLSAHGFATYGLADDVADTLPEADVARVREALALRTDLRAMRDGPLASLLERLVERTGFDATVLTQRNGIQAYGNVRKLVELVRAYDSDGEGSLRGLAARLADTVERAEEEPEAPVVDDQSDAVRVMTVHGSKGLEFPWVFVPHLGRVPREPNRELFVDAVDGELRLWLAPPVDPTSRSAAKLASTWATIAAPVLGAERLAIEAEERRLMYVALTRARERLFLAVPPGSQPEGQMPSWAAVLEPALGLDLDSQADAGVIAGTKVAVRISRIWDETPQAPSLGDSMAGVTAQAPIAAPTLDLERVGLGVAAGGIADYKYCPYRYFLGRELGLPGHIGIGTADTVGDAAERGTLVHRALEYVDFATGEVPEAILDSAGPLRDFVTSAAQRVCASAVGALAQSLPPERVHREMPFRLRLEHGTTISGVVDLALEKDEGVVIVEYKSGRKSPGTSELHATQTRIYATALEKALGKPALGITIAYVGQDEEHWTDLRDRRLAMNEGTLAGYADRIAAGDFEARPDRARCQACPFGGARRACVHRFEGS